MSAPPEAILGADVKITVKDGQGNPVRATVTVVYPSGKKVTETADEHGILIVKGDELGLMNIYASYGAAQASTTTHVIPIVFAPAANVLGFLVLCTDSWFWLVALSALSSIIAALGIRRLAAWQEPPAIVASAALFFVPIGTALAVGPCPMLPWMPLDVLVGALMLAFFEWHALRQRRKRAKRR